MAAKLNIPNVAWRPDRIVADWAPAARGDVPSADEGIRALAVLQRQPGNALFRALTKPVPTVPVDIVLRPRWRPAHIDPVADPPQPALFGRIDPIECLRLGMMPWRDAGGATVVVAPDHATYQRHHARFAAAFGPLIPATAPAAAIEAALLGRFGPMLDAKARHRVPDAESCRNWGSPALPFWVAFAAVVMVAALWFAPQGLFMVGTAWAIVTLALATALKTVAAFAAPIQVERQPDQPLLHLPVVSIMVALYREAEIAGRLIKRLEALDYPRDRLDILLVVEQDDAVTRHALSATRVPAWMRIVVVPHGVLKTKPRALNHALHLCRGSIVGIYDAEDAPAADQIRRVVHRFASAGPDVVCLQGVLDFYNPRTNWLAGCFTMEYAAWFRALLPGMARVGLAVPLGGTTLFFRRDALERLGGWDAHNVTEDADLGMRLARHGYRTELIDSVTMEEANCRVRPWIRQRSRWLKGYMITYCVHMRDPALLLRQLGPWKFIGFQVFFLTTLSQFLLAPLLWSFWLVPFGINHPVNLMAPGAALVLAGLFVWSEVTVYVVSVMALRRAGHRFNLLWPLVLHLYFPLGALAGYRALWELVARPFYWHKTAHGVCDADAAPLPQPQLPRVNPQPRLVSA